MPKKMRVVLAQLNLTAGDIKYNLQKLIAAAIKARDDLKADVIVFPELSLSGYLHEDLVFRKAFIDEILDALNKFTEQVKDIYCILGHPFPAENGLFNTCSVIYNGQIIGRHGKENLPNYGVFDEARYYLSSNDHGVVFINNVPMGIMICEDLWYEGPIQKAAAQGACLILSPNGSPFEINKHALRHQVLLKAAQSVQLPIFYVNLVCGQDDLVFDGGSMVVDAQGNICQHAGFFNEILFPIDIEVFNNEIKLPTAAITVPAEEELVYDALVLGVRDYVQKNSFPGALIGVSGGIDSALTLAIAVDALGKENVTALLMPSGFTANMSNEDAVLLANNLGVHYEIISIDPVYKSFLQTLSLTGPSGITEENIQSRCRGVILMAWSNKFGYIVLTTGNRSEMAVGYTTLYGDMAGGLAVLKDVPKTLVYKLAHYRNQLQATIPQRIFDRSPTAELAYNQKDEDTLPPYSVLDKILELYINHDLSVNEIVEQGHAEETVIDIIKKIKKSEHKRRQAPIGIRINQRAFGRDRRYPITSGFTK